MAVFFLLTWFVLLFYAVRLIARGWSAASELGGKQFIDEGTRYVTKVQHPEMVDVKQGDELLVVNFTPDDEFNRKVSDGMLSQSLKDRIDELDDPWDDDEDGDVPAVVRR